MMIQKPITRRACSHLAVAATTSVLLVAAHVAADRHSPVAPFSEGPFLVDHGHHFGGGGIASSSLGLAAAADNILALQCANGGFNWPYGGCSNTFFNITAPITMGLLKAYDATGNADYLQGAIDGANHDLNDTWSYGGLAFSSFDPKWLVMLSNASGDPQWANIAAADFFDRLADGTYGDAPGSCGGTDWFPGTTYDYIERHKCLRSGSIINIRAWDMQYMPYVANLIGNADSAPGDGVHQRDAFINNSILDALNNLDDTLDHLVIGHAGALHALALVNHSTFTPIDSPNYALINGIDNLCGLADALPSHQNTDGSVGPNGQSTAYAVLGLSAAQANGCGPYDQTIADAQAFLWSLQDPSDGAFWSDAAQSGKNIQYQGDALMVLAGTNSLVLNADATCYDAGVGDTVTVSIEMVNMVHEIVGGQFFINYDDTVLQFVDADPTVDFASQIWQLSTSGSIEYAVGINSFAGDPPVSGSATMATLTFTALQEVCDIAGLVRFSPFGDTKLTYGLNQAVYANNGDLGAITVDSTAPTFTFVPSNVTIACDAATDPANTGGFATADDNCDPAPVITFADAVDLSGCGGYTGTITRTWTATDACGNSVNQNQIITIQDTTAPVFTFVPPSISVDADAGGCTAAVSVMGAGWEFDVNAQLVATGDLSNPYAAELRSVVGDPPGPWGPTGALDYFPPAPMTFADITELSADFNMIQGCIVGGSPRFSIGIDSDGDGQVNGHVFVHWGAEGTPWSGCPSGWNSTGDLTASADGRWEAAQLGGGTVMTYSQVVTLLNSLPEQNVVYVTVALDGSWSQDQIMLVDNVQTGSTLHAFGNATATDSCDAAPVITYVRSDNSALSLTDPFPTGVTTITWIATDACGNFSQAFTNVTVSGNNVMIVDLELESGFVSDLTRCITFELTDANGNVIEVVSDEITFTGLGATATVLVPCAAYGSCLMARDTLHTLRSTGDLNVVGVTYEAFIIDPLVGGDLNDDDVVDILDFGILVHEWNVNYGTGGGTTCATAFPHADISGTGIVGLADFTFIQLNFLKAGDSCAITAPLMGSRRGMWQQAPQPQGLRSITVRELYNRGLGHLAIADLNGDGVVDETDVALFIAGVRP